MSDARDVTLRAKLAGILSTINMPQNPMERADAILSALNSAGLSSPEWMPIETAPKDGTRVLGYGGWPNHTGRGLFLATWFQTVLAGREGWWESNAMRVELTHWMPLPAPPLEATDTLHKEIDR